MDFRKFAEEKKQELIRDLQGCIRIPSVYAEDDSGFPYGKEVHQCLEYVLQTAERMGFSTFNMDEQAGWCEYGQGEEMIAVLCHLDVVPAGDGWSVPPYEGLVLDGRIYGRGTMDDKGPAMAALYGLAALRDSGLPIKRRIRLIFGLNEETGSADMKYYLSHGGEVPVMGITPDGEYPVINGEKGLVGETFARSFSQSGGLFLEELKGGESHNIVPASAFAQIRCSKEQAEQIAGLEAEKIFCTPGESGIRIEAQGRSAHGGTPWEGENAIGRLLLFLKELPFEGQLAQIISFLADGFGMEWNGSSLGIAMEDDLSGALTMNLGVISASEKEISVKLNYRYPVTRSFAECGPRIEQLFQEAGFQTAALLHKSSLYMPEESALVRKLLEVYTRCTGKEAKPKCIGGGTYAKMMPNTLAFGPIFPGDEVREHKPDEYMELNRLIDNVTILAHAMYELSR